MTFTSRKPLHLLLTGRTTSTSYSMRFRRPTHFTKTFTSCTPPPPSLTSPYRNPSWAVQAVHAVRGSFLFSSFSHPGHVEWKKKKKDLASYLNRQGHPPEKLFNTLPSSFSLCVFFAPSNFGCPGVAFYNTERLLDGFFDKLLIFKSISFDIVHAMKSIFRWHTVLFLLSYFAAITLEFGAEWYHRTSTSLGRN